MRTSIQRNLQRLILVIIGAAVLPFVFVACDKQPAKREVVLYTSCDDYLLREVQARFEKQSGISLRIVGDTEATKTTGLIQRLIGEREHPRCDVWWSNEAMGSVRLEAEGLLAPSKPAALQHEFSGVWPLGLSSGAWYGFALRQRAIVFNTSRVSEAEAPRSIGELASPKWKGRIGMARPQFGTTRSQMAYLVSTCGEPALRAWLSALHSGGVRLYDGNSAVVRAVAMGEVDAGLTDTDDIIAGQREKWPVARAREDASIASGGLCACDPLAIPNTTAIVRGAPHPAEAAALLDFLLSAEVERFLAESESGNRPIREALAIELGAKLPAVSTVPVDWKKVHEADARAMGVCDEVFAGSHR